MSRRRYRFNEETQQLEEIGLDEPIKPRIELMPGTMYDDLRTAEGVDISSRRKHAEYMQRNGLAMASDFTNHWAKKQAERETFRKGEHKDPARREALGRALYQLEKKHAR